MSVSLTQARDIFNGLETGDGSEFFTHVVDDATSEIRRIPTLQAAAIDHGRTRDADVVEKYIR